MFDNLTILDLEFTEEFSVNVLFLSIHIVVIMGFDIMALCAEYCRYFIHIIQFKLKVKIKRSKLI